MAKLPCYHLTKSAEAYAITDTGQQEPIDVFLCTWADGNPGRLMDAPRWLTYRTLAGEPVKPHKDCYRCPGYQPRPTKETDSNE